MTIGKGLDLTGKGLVVYKSIRIVNLSTSKVFSSLYHVYINSYCKNAFSFMTSSDLKEAARVQFLIQYNKFTCKPMLGY